MKTPCRAIERAGYRPGEDVGLALDAAASQFWRDGRYRLEGELTSAEMVDLLADWAQRWPLLSVEDGLAEEDWTHWPALKRALSGRALVMGDDLLCTNPARIRRAIDSDAADALLLKVNQIGTLGEAAGACRLARSAGWHVTVSARSGETEDHWLADLAGRLARATHQDRLNHAIRAPRQVQPPAANRGRQRHAARGSDRLGLRRAPFQPRRHQQPQNERHDADQRHEQHDLAHLGHAEQVDEKTGQQDAEGARELEEGHVQREHAAQKAVGARSSG